MGVRSEHRANVEALIYVTNGLRCMYLKTLGKLCFEGEGKLGFVNWPKSCY